MKFFMSSILALGATASLGLVGCGPVNDYKDSKHMEKEHKRLVDQVNGEAGSLNAEYSVNLSPAYDFIYTDALAKQTSWSKFSAPQRADIKARLLSILSKIGRIREIGHHKNMKVKADNGVLDVMHRRANIYLTSLNEYQTKPKSDSSSNSNGGSSPKP